MDSLDKCRLKQTQHLQWIVPFLFQEDSLSIYKKLDFDLVAFTDINWLILLCSFIEIIKEVSNRSKLSAQFHSTSVLLLDYLTIGTLLRDTSILRK